MPRFYVEVPHGASKEECDKAIQMFLSTGSHFITNADWGCKDGEHKAWFICEIEDKESVLRILPPLFRPVAKIVEVQKFSVKDIPEIMDSHEK
jgi:hypothetical protein